MSCLSCRWEFMAISFRHHETRDRGFSARGLAQLIEKSSQSHQGIDLDPRHIIKDNVCTSRFVKHPARHVDAKLRILTIQIGIQRFNPDDHCRFITKPNCPQDCDLPIKERVKLVDNPRRTELAGSVCMRCAIPTRRTCWKPVLA